MWSKSPRWRWWKKQQLNNPSWSDKSNHSDPSFDIRESVRTRCSQSNHILDKYCTNYCASVKDMKLGTVAPKQRGHRNHMDLSLVKSSVEFNQTKGNIVKVKRTTAQIAEMLLVNLKRNVESTGSVENVWTFECPSISLDGFCSMTKVTQSWSWMHAGPVPRFLCYCCNLTAAAH